MFNHNTLEQDIERLSREVAEKRQSPEYRTVPGKEILKQTLQPIVSQSLSRAKSDEEAEEVEQSAIPDYLRDSPEEVKLIVEKLVDSVFHQGLAKTIKTAASVGPFVLDAFHDALTDKLYEELKARKLI